MAEDNSKRMSITLATTAIGLSVSYPDGSPVQITMPKPFGAIRPARRRRRLSSGWRGDFS